MERNEAIRIIRDNHQALKAVGVMHAYLFGSVSRDNAQSGSDIDVMIDVAYEPFTLFKIIRVKNTLQDILAQPVDVVVRADALQGHRLHKAAKEAVSVF